jgi:hypothetical protein
MRGHPFDASASPRRGVDVSERTTSSRALGTLLFGKVFEDLNTDFFGDRAFDPAHAIPKPDDFALSFGVHEPTSKVDTTEHNKNKLASPFARIPWTPTKCRFLEINDEQGELKPITRFRDQ